MGHTSFSLIFLLLLLLLPSVATSPEKESHEFWSPVLYLNSHLCSEELLKVLKLL